jgi:hypothetical protein
MRKITEIAAALSLFVLAATPVSEALAAPRHHARVHRAQCRLCVAHVGRPLYVERRSFLDPGTQVPVGRYQYYEYMPAYVWGDPVSTYQRSWYMDENLHQAFDPQPTHPIWGLFGPTD